MIGLPRPRRPGLCPVASGPRRWRIVIDVPWRPPHSRAVRHRRRDRVCRDRGRSSTRPGAVATAHGWPRRRHRVAPANPMGVRFSPG